MIHPPALIHKLEVNARNVDQHGVITVHLCDKKHGYRTWGVSERTEFKDVDKGDGYRFGLSREGVEVDVKCAGSHDKDGFVTVYFL